MAKKRKLKPRDRAAATRRNVPVTLPGITWDTGATGPAATARQRVVEDAADIDPETGEVRNPNGIRRIRYVDMLEVWLKQETISTAGYNYAVKLRDAFEATQRAPGWPDNDRVQASPNHGASALIRTKRLSKYHSVARFILPGDWPVIDYFVLRNRENKADFSGFKYKGQLARLGPALDRAAARMDMPVRIAKLLGRAK